jgi:NADP-dependent 3-hydroxy acid dehydrogenase YdfG
MPSSAHSDKIVLITGASSGMGKETALQLGLKGVKGLTLFARRKGLLDEVAEGVYCRKKTYFTL